MGIKSLGTRSPYFFIMKKIFPYNEGLDGELSGEGFLECLTLVLLDTPLLKFTVSIFPEITGVNDEYGTTKCLDDNPGLPRIKRRHRLMGDLYWT